MIRKNLSDVMREVLNEPTSQIAMLHEDYSLWLKGEQNKQALTYVAATPLGVIANWNGELWQPKGQKLNLPMQVGILSHDKFLMWEASPTFKGYYWDQDILPEKPLTFILFAWLEDKVEAYIATPAIGAPVHFCWAPEQAEQLLGFCNEIITANDPEVGIQLRNFLLEAAYHKEDD